MLAQGYHSIRLTAECQLQLVFVREDIPAEDSGRASECGGGNKKGEDNGGKHFGDPLSAREKKWKYSVEEGKRRRAALKQV
jgi:hypothetical protein